MSGIPRRLALEALTGFGFAFASPLQSQQVVGEPTGRIAPLAELVNVFEIQEMARRKLSDPVYATVSGTHRAALERITFRPRLMVNVTQLDLSLDLLGTKLFSPILMGPVWGQDAFHPEGELASVRGATASKTLMVVSCRSAKPLPEIVKAAGDSPLWYQVYPDADPKVTVAACQAAVKLGCKAVCITVGAPPQAGASNTATWDTINLIKQSVTAPLLVKGILSPDEAAAAVTKGVQGIVISNHASSESMGFADPMEMLPSIANAVGGRLPILIDGSFRRGTDVMKALALGARAVLIARPAMWGLAAYGTEGVKAVFEMLQTELARTMAMCGKPSLSAIDASVVKIHRR